MNKILTAAAKLPIDEQADFVKDCIELNKELSMTSDFQQWLTTAYHNQAAAYRAALDREIRHTYVIYGNPLPSDVRAKLLASLKEIEFPPLAKYDGIKDGNEMKIFNTTPKPNKVLLLREATEKL